MDWVDAAARLSGAIYAPLRPAIAQLSSDRWPDHHDLTLLAAEVRNSRGVPIRFVPLRDPARHDRVHYEAHIAATGEVETRPENWHDLFNALAWVTFPCAKAAINAQHAAIMEAGGESELRHRSPARDALTLFDEGGVIVASSSPEMHRLIVDFRWKELFWERRAELKATTHFLAFGHACYEQSLAPYLGMVAKTVLVAVDGDFLSAPPERQTALADARVAGHLANRANFRSPKSLPPMPVLGVPDWHGANAQASFYDDAKHFRSKGLRPK
ncbi:MAG: DUF3025 domain-containing protein [Usitatibacter sp.]